MLIRAALRALLPPRRVSALRRIEAFPLGGAPVRAPVRIAWDAHLVPSLEAESEADLAVALGVVHAHLRLAQMEALRAAACGRIASVIGRRGVALDRTLHAIDSGRAVPAILAGLPEATRAWAQGFVDGVNHHRRAVRTLPWELRVLGWDPAPWTLEDLFRVARLAAADLSWMVAHRLLAARRAAGEAWPALWQELLSGGAPADWSPQDAEESVVAAALRAGSNSAAAGAGRSARGAALIASDPHLGLALPCLWLMAGLHAPGLDAVGLMLPGLPFIGLGRNRHVAWGGTSLHAASSELIDVSGLPETAFTERRVTITVRGAADETLVLRESLFGPVVGDGLLMRSERPLALRWVGHAASDELTAMLGVLRARGWDQFNAALDGFAVPGQTMVYAGTDGRVGRRVAAHMFRRPNTPPPDLVVAPEAAAPLDALAAGEAMPRALAEDGIVASANEAPAASAFPLGFFFAPNDRARRLRALLERPGLGEAEMRSLQRDVTVPGALALRDWLLPLLVPGTARERRLAEAWAAWDGRYAVESEGALAHELVLAALGDALFAPSVLGWLQAVWTTRLLIARRLAELEPDALRAALAQALPVAASRFARWRRWGSVHRHRPSHALAALPVIGRRYRGRRFAASGANDTLDKTGHGPVRGPHEVRFGACARHVSDLAEADANRFVLFGGQDGWMGSEAFDDQVALWRDGRMITLPLDGAVSRRDALRVTVLVPG